MPNLVVSAVAKWNGTALKKGEKQITGFQKATNLLAKAFVAAFAVQKVAAFGAASVKAFAADEKAAKSLAITLQNTGNGFATIATEGFISRMQKTYKVLDDDLRPAFQTLLTATGDLSTSQNALELALDISAGTGKSLASVTAALAKGYAGNTTALSRLGAGLDKALIATGDMDKITGALSAKFKGQALGATKTYAGQMDALAVSSANVKETIGKGILDALAIFSGDGTNGINAATTAMEDFAVTIADAVVGFAELSKAVKDSFIGEILYKAMKGSAVALLLKALGNYGKSKGNEAAKTAAYTSTSMYFTAETAERAKITKTLKTQNNVEKEKERLAKAKLAADKKQAEMDELKKKFDVGRINLEVALANAKDDAEKTRIKSLLTIADDDVNSAAKRLAELDKANKDKLNAEYIAAVSLGNLAEASRLASLGLKGITIGGVAIENFAGKVADPSGVANELLATAVSIEAETALKEAEEAVKRSTKIAQEADAIIAAMAGTAGGPVNYGYSANTPSFSYGANSAPTFIFNDAVGTSDNFAEAVKVAIQKINRTGDSTTYAGAL
jgi:hypothetical protein